MPWTSPSSWRLAEKWVAARLREAVVSAGNEGYGAAARALRSVASLSVEPDHRHLSRYLVAALHPEVTNDARSLRGVGETANRKIKSSSRALYLAPSIAALLEVSSAKLARSLEAASVAIRAERGVSATAATVPSSGTKRQQKAAAADERDYVSVLEAEFEEARAEMDRLDERAKQERRRSSHLRKLG
jgi:hypothetical protein